MEIQKTTFEMGNDFHAIMVCEHCGATQENKSGYHDHYYHTRVIPEMYCKACGMNRAGDHQMHDPPTAKCKFCECEIHPSQSICGECACEEDGL